MNVRWWLFLGVAHETQRMVYETPLARLARLFGEVAQRIGDVLLPAFRRTADAMNAFELVFGASSTSVDAR